MAGYFPDSPGRGAEKKNPLKKINFSEKIVNIKIIKSDMVPIL